MRSIKEAEILKQKYGKVFWSKEYGLLWCGEARNMCGATPRYYYAEYLIG